MPFLKKSADYLIEWLWKVWDCVKFILIGFGLLGLSFFSAYASTLVVRLSYGWVFLFSFIYLFCISMGLVLEGVSGYDYIACIRVVLKYAAVLALTIFTIFYSSAFFITRGILSQGESISLGIIVWFISYFIYYIVINLLHSFLKFRSFWSFVSIICFWGGILVFMVYTCIKKDCCYQYYSGSSLPISETAKIWLNGVDSFQIDGTANKDMKLIAGGAYCTPRSVILLPGNHRIMGVPKESFFDFRKDYKRYKLDGKADSGLLLQVQASAEYDCHFQYRCIELVEGVYSCSYELSCKESH